MRRFLAARIIVKFPGVRTVGIRAAATLRDAWLMVGVTLLLVFVLEGAYRVQGEARQAIAMHNFRQHLTPSPTDTSPWFDAYRDELTRVEQLQWEPYLYVRNPPFAGKYITIDSMGHRVTPTTSLAGAPSTHVVFFGGSTIFGWYQRDAHTIPAVAVRRLQSLAGDRLRIDAKNHGVPGRTFTQEVLELALLLRSGERPDVVVFYDGINDVDAAVQTGHGGMPLNEVNRENDFRRGRDAASDSVPGLKNDVRALMRGARATLARLQIAQRVVALRSPLPRHSAPADTIAIRLARMYAENARLVEALASHYGFRALYVWQPAIASSGKPLTIRERELLPPATIDSVRLAAPALLRAAMHPIAGDRFIDATGVFARDSMDVYIDRIGHTYERANPRIVDTLLPALASASLSADVTSRATSSTDRSRAQMLTKVMTARK